MLKIENKVVFITNMMQLNSKGMFYWNHSRFSSNPFRKKQQTQWEGSIPDYQIALKRFQEFFGENYPEEYTKDFFVEDSTIDISNNHKKEINKFIRLNGGDLKIPYPMAKGYSDIFVIKKEVLFPIARLCGVFSAMNMFAEIALPTAIVLTVNRKDITLLNDTEFEKYTEWGEERGKLEEQYQYDFRLLCEKWKKKNLYMHPIKLSKWKV